MHIRAKSLVSLVSFVSLVFCGLILTCAATSPGQEKTQAPASSSTCTRDNALQVIQQQIDLSKTFDNDVHRIAVLLRAADLIWPYQEEKARAAFSEAFDIAVRNFKEKGDKDSSEGRLMVQGIDYRYRVITGIARRDPVWAGKLSKQILQDEADEARDQAAKDADRERIGEKLLGVASGLLASNPSGAISFARSSLAYPTTISLPMFLYKLAALDRAAADRFYQEALSAYQSAPLENFLYLSSYPFAQRREAGEVPVYTLYAVPPELKPNPLLEGLFIQALLTRARSLLQNPVPPDPKRRWSDASQIYMALSRLERDVASSVPELSAAVQELKGSVGALLSEKDAQRADQMLADPPPKKSFDEAVAAADRLADAGTREARIAMLLLNATDAETLEQIESAAAKLDDLNLRKVVLSQVYFNRAQESLKAKRIDEARKFAAKVDELDQRAYLYARIASESLKVNKTDTQAREMLEEVLDAVARAPNTEIKARAQFAVAYLYKSFDPSRAIAVLGEAVKTTNRLETIDLSSDTVRKRIEGKAFGFYSGLTSPGSSPETAFREIGKVDFDGTLYLASNLSDKYLRAVASLALAEQCLKDEAAKPKPKKPAANKP